MSIAEIMPAVQALSREERLQLARILFEEFATEELSSLFKDGQVFPIYTPEYAPGAAIQLAKALMDDTSAS